MKFVICRRSQLADCFRRHGHAPASGCADYRCTGQNAGAAGARPVLFPPRPPVRAFDRERREDILRSGTFLQVAARELPREAKLLHPQKRADAWRPATRQLVNAAAGPVIAGAGFRI